MAYGTFDYGTDVYGAFPAPLALAATFKQQASLQATVSRIGTPVFVSALKIIGGAWRNGVPILLATDGLNIVQCFADTTSDIDSVLKTALWDMKEPERTKQMTKAGVEVFSQDAVTLAISLDTEKSSQVSSINAESVVLWQNASANIVDWENNALTIVVWAAGGYQFFQGSAEEFGRYLGYTLRSSSPQFVINGVLMQFEPRGFWGT